MISPCPLWRTARAPFSNVTSSKSSGASLIASGSSELSLQRPAQLAEGAVEDRRAHPRHQRVVVPEVVHGEQPRREVVLPAAEVVQVPEAELRAGRAPAALLERPVRQPVDLAGHPDDALERVGV